MSERQTIPWGPGHPQFELTIDDLFEPDEAYAADYADWAILPYLTIDELTALSFGFDPDAADWANILCPEHPFSKKYRRRHKQATRATEIAQLDTPVSLRAYVRWAKKEGIEIESGLITAMRPGSLASGSEAEGTTHQKIRKSITKMALGMVAVHYGYDPNNPNLEIYDEIVRDLICVVSVDAKSVEKILTSANDDSHDLLSESEVAVAYRTIYGMAVTAFNYDPAAKRGRAVPEIVKAVENNANGIDAGTVRSRLREAVRLFVRAKDVP